MDTTGQRGRPSIFKNAPVAYQNASKSHGQLAERFREGFTAAVAGKEIDSNPYRATNKAGGHKQLAEGRIAAWNEGYLVAAKKNGMIRAKYSNVKVKDLVAA